MSWFKERKVSTNIFITYLFLLVLILVLGGLSLYQLHQVNYVTMELEHNWLPATRMLGDMNKAISDLRMAEINLATTGTPQEQEFYRDQISSLIKTVEVEQQAYEPTMTVVEEKKMYADLILCWQEYLGHTHTVLQLAEENRKDEAASRIRGEAQQTYEQLNRILLNLINFNVASGIDTSRRGDLILALSSIQIITLIVLAVIIGGILSLVLRYFILIHVHIRKKYKITPIRH